MILIGRAAGHPYVLTLRLKVSLALRDVFALPRSHNIGKRKDLGNGATHLPISSCTRLHPQNPELQNPEVCAGAGEVHGKVVGRLCSAYS